MSTNLKLSKIYYSTEGYWKGHSAIAKLAEKANATESVSKDCLQRQALWQIYLPPAKYIPRPHWVVDKPNKIHQADLLFLPHDKVGRETYKYTWVVIDIASRYKDAEPLTSKSSDEVAKAFSNIYSRKLKWPEKMILDPGKEFMGYLTSLFQKHNITVQRSEAGNHRAQAFVERANRTLVERLFSHQYAQEMIIDERSRVWVRRLPKILETLNSTPIKITGKEPMKALGYKEVEIKRQEYKRPVGLDEIRLPPGVTVR